MRVVAVPWPSVHSPGADVVLAGRVAVAGHLLGDEQALLVDDALHVQRAVAAAPRLQLGARPALQADRPGGVRTGATPPGLEPMTPCRATVTCGRAETL